MQKWRVTLGINLRCCLEKKGNTYSLQSKNELTLGQANEILAKGSAWILSFFSGNVVGQPPFASVSPSFLV